MIISRENKLIYTQTFRYYEDTVEKTRTITTYPKIVYLISKFDQSRKTGPCAEKEGYRSETLIAHSLLIPHSTNINGEHNKTLNIELPIPVIDLETILKERDITIEDKVE